MITEKQLITYLETENPRFAFVIADKNNLPTIEWLEKETALTHEQIATARYAYWQTLKDYNTLELLLSIVKIYKKAVKNNIDITEGTLNNIKTQTKLPFSRIHIKQLQTYVDRQIERQPETQNA